MPGRRAFLRSGAAAAALALPLARARAQSAATLKFQTFMAPTSNIRTLMLKPWMDKVEQDSGGRIKFEGYPAMRLGGTPRRCSRCTCTGAAYSIRARSSSVRWRTSGA